MIVTIKNIQSSTLKTYYFFRNIVNYLVYGEDTRVRTPLIKVSPK